MDMKLNHSDLSVLFAKIAGVSVSEAESFTKSVFELIVDGLERDGIVKINGLGTFKVVNVEKRLSVNVNTGERFEIKEHKKLSFIPAESLKSTINAPFSMFQPVEIDDDFDDGETMIDEHLSDDDMDDSSDDMRDEKDNLDSLKKEDSAVIRNKEMEASVVAEPLLSLDCIEEEMPISDVNVDLANTVDIKEEIPVVVSDYLSYSVVNKENKEIIEKETPIIIDKMEHTDVEEKQIQDKSEQETGQQCETMKSIAFDETVTDKSLIEHGVKEPQKTDINKRNKTRNGNKSKSFSLLLIFLLILCFGGYYLYENNFKFIKNIPEYIAEVPEANLLKMDSVNESEISGDSVFSVLKDSAECLMEDTIEITERIDSFAIEKSSEHLASPKKNVPEKEKFELVDAVAKRELSTIFVADTMDYRIIGTICEHIVRSEETLIRISLKHYGDKRLWPYIVKYNNMVKPNDLACDMVLKIPRLVPVD